MAEIDKFIKSQKSRLNLLKRLYSALPEELKKIEYKLTIQNDYINVMWFVEGRGEVVLFLSDCFGKKVDLRSHSPSITTFYKPDELQKALEETFPQV